MLSFGTNSFLLRLRPTLSTTFSLGGIFLGTAGRNYSTRYMLHSPSPSAPREVPTPLVFLSSSSWDKNSDTGMTELAAMFAGRGFTCLEVDLSHSPQEDSSTSESIMRHYESELSSHIRLCGIPFAPVIIARSAGSLIAQTYISSHPAAALLLISPPPSNSSVTSSLLPTPLREFDFEPRFPLAILCTEKEGSVLRKENRLSADPNVDLIVVPSLEDIDGQVGFVKIEQWLDDIGI